MIASFAYCLLQFILSSEVKNSSTTWLFRHPSEYTRGKCTRKGDVETC